MTTTPPAVNPLDGPIKTTYEDLGAGLNEGVSRAGLADNEMAVLENFFPFGKKLVRRGGTTAITSVPYTENITGIINYKRTSTSAVKTIVGGLTSLAVLSGTALMALANNSGSITSDDHLWTLLQYNNIGYGTRRNAGLRRFTDEVHSLAGITAPQIAPTLVQGAAGVLTAADYYGVVTFFNRETGAESNPSPVSAVCTIAASKQINWSEIPISTEYQVNSRRLYRTLPGQQGNYLFVAEIDNNFDTTYTDNVPVANLGDFASFDNDLPPSGLEISDVFSERLWASDGGDLVFSEAFMFESYASDSVIRINPDDGHRMSAIHADGSRLVVGKTNKVYALTGTDRSNFAVDVISDRHGIASHHSVKSAEGQLLWFEGNSFYRIYGGGQPESIATVKMKKTLERIPANRREYVVSAVYPKWGWYLSSVTLDSGTQNNAVLCYNYKSDAWCVFKFPTTAPAVFGEVFDSNFAQILYCSFYAAQLYQMDLGNNDFGTPITAKFRTGSRRINQAGLLSALRRFFIHCTSVAGTMTFRAYRNDDDVAFKTRNNVSLFYPGQSWKGYDMTTLRNPGSTWALEGEYSGAAPLEIEGLAFETTPVFRRLRSK